MLLNVSASRPISSAEAGTFSRCVRSPAAIRWAASVMASTGRSARPARNQPPASDTASASGMVTRSTSSSRFKVWSTDSIDVPTWTM